MARSIRQREIGAEQHPRHILNGLLAWVALTVPVTVRLPAAEPLQLDLTVRDAPGRAGDFKMGASRNPGGHELTVDGISLLRDGRRWLPVMGEFQYARYAAPEWREELLKMKAGGVDLVATYVFWIFHEEIEGRFDWSGARDLRKFVQTCGEVGLPVVVRMGPWSHGEVRNGGLPDWLLQKGCKLRSDDPAYLEQVRILYGEIAGQLKGQLWKDGGPVIGVQLENEYSGPAAHLLTLKRLAREAGVDVPLYTRTGWPELSTPMPFGEILPLFGAYAEGFWDRELTPMPGTYWQAFCFEPLRTDTAIATDELGVRKAGDESTTGRYPYLTCELGGGMMNSYHRRIRIKPEDIASVAITKVGSGSNLPGYYMYHGGENPDGRLSTLQEQQATPLTNWNDLPVKSYDFQAPLGEFGQMRAHYHLLRRLHLFLHDYGPLLATMPVRLPSVRPESGSDTRTLRWSVRSDGTTGFLFVNNYQRLQPMPAKEGVQFDLQLGDGLFRLPEEPCTVPADSSFFWPVNLDLGGVTLVYATAQPICRLEVKGTSYTVFAKIAGVSAEFAFDASGLMVESANGRLNIAHDRIHIRGVEAGTGAAIRLRNAGGRQVSIILLGETDSLACWKGTWHGRERLFLTTAGLTLDNDTLRLKSVVPADVSVAMLPAPDAVKVDGVEAESKVDGVFRRFNVLPEPLGQVRLKLEPVQPAGPARTISMGRSKVAEAPGDADFAQAAVWRVKLPANVDPDRELMLRLHYIGDAARVYLGGRLLTDDFYNGNYLDIGLKRYAPGIYQQELLVKILPLQKGAPIYLAADAWPDFANAKSVDALSGIDVLEMQTMELK